MAEGETSAYKPYAPARRPGGKPDEAPKYRVLVHRQHFGRYERLTEVVGLTQAQRFHDHVSQTPGAKPEGVHMTMLRGKAGKPHEDGFSRTLHWRMPGSGARVDYQYNAKYTGGAEGDPHAIVRIIAVSLGSH